jgi:hypothetical protein
MLQLMQLLLIYHHHIKILFYLGMFVTLSKKKRRKSRFEFVRHDRTLLKLMKPGSSLVIIETAVKDRTFDQSKSCEQKKI